MHLRISLLFLLLFLRYSAYSQVNKLELGGKSNVESQSQQYGEYSSDYLNWKQGLNDKTHIDYALLFTPQFQFGSVQPKQHLNAEIDFIGSWYPSWAKRNEGHLVWSLFYNQSFFKYTTEEFSNHQHLNLHTNAGNTYPDNYSFTFAGLWWEQNITSYMAFRVGQLLSQSIYAVNDYIDDDRNDFMASPLSGPDAANWLDYPVGIGLQVGLWSQNFSMYVGLQDATASGEYIDFKSFAAGKYVYFFEAAYQPNYGKEKEGKYGITLSYTDKLSKLDSARSSHSLVFNFFQKFNDKFAVFGRYSESFELFPNLKSSYTTGVAIDESIIKYPNRIGLAYIFAKPSDLKLNNENGIEVYWRIYFKYWLAITPDFQMYFTRAYSKGSSVSMIAGLRISVQV